MKRIKYLQFIMVLSVCLVMLGGLQVKAQTVNTKSSDVTLKAPDVDSCMEVIDSDGDGVPESVISDSCSFDGSAKKVLEPAETAYVCFEYGSFTCPCNPGDFNCFTYKSATIGAAHHNPWVYIGGKVMYLPW